MRPSTKLSEQIIRVEVQSAQSPLAGCCDHQGLRLRLFGERVTGYELLPLALEWPGVGRCDCEGIKLLVIRSGYLDECATAVTLCSDEDR